MTISPNLANLQRRTRIKHRSKTKARAQADRRRLIARLTAESPWCELGPVIHEVDPAWPCARRAEGLHELRKRSAGGSTTNLDNLKRACNRCNSWVEDHPVTARRLGLVIRAGDPLFDELAATRDPS
ncbi:MAG: hypothetical protein KA755_01580 [Candidatus Microthrix sp.]|nr:hypothetical protein [Candidatus Microthrix sp.]